MLERYIEYSPGAGLGSRDRILSPELLSPQQRLPAVLNILQNGGQTLTVLTMNSDTDAWKSWHAINTEMRRKVGLSVAHPTSTRHHLIQCIEPIGAAAKSTIDDKEWSITPLGIAMKPVLIFGWQHILELGINPMALLGDISHGGKKDARGNFQTTPPVVRFKILKALPENVHKTIAQITHEIGISDTNVVSRQADDLAEAKFIEKKSTTPLDEAPFATYYKTEIGKNSREWEPWTSKRSRNVNSSQRVLNAVNVLEQQGEPITLDRVIKVLAEDLPTSTTAILESQLVLTFWSRPEKGYLRREGFSADNFSDVVITSKGLVAFGTLLAKIDQWANNMTSLREINDIAEQLAKNPHSYQDLYRQIVGNYTQFSPNKNRDKQGYIAKALDAITKNPGRFAANDLGQAIGTSNANSHKIVAEMLKAGSIRREKGPKGIRYVLYPNFKSDASNS